MGDALQPVSKARQGLELAEVLLLSAACIAPALPNALLTLPKLPRDPF